MGPNVVGWRCAPAGLWRLVVAGLLLAAGACGDPEPYAIGYVGGLTGGFGNLGQEGRDGVMLAVERANDGGGIDGHWIELIVKDDQQDENIALAVDQELIDAGVAAIIGHMTSSMSVAAVPLINRSDVPMVSPTTSTNALSGIDDQFLRVYAPNRLEAAKLAAHARNDLALSRVQVVYDLSNRAHTETWLEAFGGEFKRLGGTLAPSISYTSDPSVRFRALAESVVGTAPDGLLILANALDTARLCQQLRNLGFPGAILVSQWSVTTDILKLGGNAAEGIRFLNTYDRDSEKPRFLAFKSDFKKRFNYEPDFAAVFAYEAAEVVLQSLRDAGGTRDLKKAILSRRRFQGLQGEFEFDEFGDVVRDMVLMTIRDGRFAYVR